MIAGIIIGAVLVLLILWALGGRRRLAAMDENINSTMKQFCVQLSSCFDVLTTLLELTGRCAAQESRSLLETVRLYRGDMSALPTPEEISRQERVLDETAERMRAVAERYPALKADETYTKGLAAMDSYKKMTRTSRLIYNDSVTKLNRELCRFPASLLGRAFGFRRRAYLVAEEEAPGVK